MISLKLLLFLFLCSILSNNQIEQIDSEAFYGLSSLKKLVLQNCALTRIPSDALRRIRTLAAL